MPVSFRPPTRSLDFNLFLGAFKAAGAQTSVNGYPRAIHWWTRSASAANSRASQSRTSKRPTVGSFITSKVLEQADAGIFAFDLAYIGAVDGKVGDAGARTGPRPVELWAGRSSYTTILIL